MEARKTKQHYNRVLRPGTANVVAVSSYDTVTGSGSLTTVQYCAV